MPRYYMHRALALAIWTPSLLAAQVEVGSPAWRTLAADTGTKLLLEHRYMGGTADSASVRLVKDGYYWIELSKSPARPVIRRVDGNSQAFVSPSEAPGREGATLFELYPGSSGVHMITVPDVPADSAAVLRLYSHDGEATIQRRMKDTEWGIGLALAAGWHSGYQLVPSAGVDPRGGADFEGSLLIESGRGLGIDLGIIRQSLPDVGYGVTWYVLEPRVRLLDGRMFGTSATELWGFVRLGQARSTPAHGIDPSLFGAGLRVRQQLRGAGRRRGWAVFAGYFHGRVGGVPEETHRGMHRLSAGLTWVP